MLVYSLASTVHIYIYIIFINIESHTHTHLRASPLSGRERGADGGLEAQLLWLQEQEDR